MLHVSEQVPIAGLVFAAILWLIGAYLFWINPKLLYGLAPLLGIVSFIAGIFAGIVALIGARRARNSASMHDGSIVNAAAMDPNHPHEMSGQDFERFIADLFRRQGYRVEEVGATAANAGRGDGGVDLILRRDGETLEHLVQCKCYQVWDVGEPKVREFYGAMAAHVTRCEGIIITCGRFTEPARKFAHGKPLRLVDGEELRRMQETTNWVTPAVAAYTPRPDTASASPPMCPRCKTPMIRRMAKRGKHAGVAFWGCKNYPACDQKAPLNPRASAS